MGKPQQSFLFLVSIIPVIFISFFSCEDAARITSRCQLTASIRYFNDSAANFTITYLDSTNWDTLQQHLESQTFSHEDSTIRVPGNAEYFDTLTVTWDFEHHDIYYKDGTVCSTLVDLDLYALVFQSDTLIKKIDLNLHCSSLFLDTSYVDTTTDLSINKFTANKVFSIP